MALRIGGKKMEEPIEEVPMEESAPDMMSELPPDLGLEEEPAAPEGDGAGSVNPLQVHYKTGQERLQEACEQCMYYIPEGACQIVAGEIDPSGVCNVFSPMAAPEEEMPTEEPMPEGEPYPEEEAPVEEPPVEG